VKDKESERKKEREKAARTQARDKRREERKKESALSTGKTIPLEEEHVKAIDSRSPDVSFWCLWV